MVNVIHFDWSTIVTFKESNHNHSFWLINYTKVDKKKQILGLVLLLMKKG